MTSAFLVWLKRHKTAKIVNLVTRKLFRTEEASCRVSSCCVVESPTIRERIKSWFHSSTSTSTSTYFSAFLGTRNGWREDTTTGRATPERISSRFVRLKSLQAIKLFLSHLLTAFPWWKMKQHRFFLSMNSTGPFLFHPTPRRTQRTKKEDTQNQTARFFFCIRLHLNVNRRH